MLKMIALVLLVATGIENIYHYFLSKPACLKLDARKSYQAFTAKERLTLFHHLRHAIFMAVGVLLLIILTGKEIFDGGNLLQKGCFLGCLTCIIMPLGEMIYYRWSVNRYWKDDMTANEMSAYHEFCERYYRHSFSLNGIGRQKLRFVLLSIGVCILISLSLLIFKL